MSEHKDDARNSGEMRCSTAIERIANRMYAAPVSTPNGQRIYGQVTLCQLMQDVLEELIVDMHHEGYERAACILSENRRSLDGVIDTLKASGQIVEAIGKIRP